MLAILIGVVMGAGSARVGIASTLGVFRVPGWPFEVEAKDMTADSTVAEIEATGGTALGIEVDVRDREAVEVMVARVVQEWGRVDVLVASTGGGRGRPKDTKASTLDRRSCNS
jgi:3-oxoacyl-[acyl-carrier protein] reductase